MQKQHGSRFWPKIIIKRSRDRISRRDQIEAENHLAFSF